MNICQKGFFSFWLTVVVHGVHGTYLLDLRLLALEGTDGGPNAVLLCWFPPMFHQTCWFEYGPWPFGFCFPSGRPRDVCVHAPTRRCAVLSLSLIVPSSFRFPLWVDLFDMADRVARSPSFGHRELVGWPWTLVLWPCMDEGAFPLTTDSAIYHRAHSKAYSATRSSAREPYNNGKIILIRVKLLRCKHFDKNISSQHNYARDSTSNTPETSRLTCAISNRIVWLNRPSYLLLNANSDGRSETSGVNSAVSEVSELLSNFLLSSRNLSVSPSKSEPEKSQKEKDLSLFVGFFYL
ncbi:hypothetical protein VNO77_20301 [Canavalia gladiata]|uniref:Uncharacterized protein n=1 Tax=Canavalia gladiata TaxID=3824 RepID=A0AAN9LU60_CANGL